MWGSARMEQAKCRWHIDRTTHLCFLGGLFHWGGARALGVGGLPASPSLWLRHCKHTNFLRQDIPFFDIASIIFSSDISRNKSPKRVKNEFNFWQQNLLIMSINDMKRKTTRTNNFSRKCGSWKHMPLLIFIIAKPFSGCCFNSDGIWWSGFDSNHPLGPVHPAWNYSLFPHARLA